MPTYTEPTWGDACDQYVQRVSAFTERPMPFSLISSMVIRYLQLHFSSADLIMNKGLKTLLWTPDVKTSKLFIGSGQADNARNASQKAAIYVNREEVKPIDVYLPPTMCKISWNNVESPDTWDTILAGVTSVRCDSRMASEAELMSEEIFHLLVLFLPSIEEDCNLDSFGVTVQKTGKTETGMFSATVAISWNVRMRYINEQELPY